MYTFPNIKKNIVLNQDISRNSISIKRYQEKETEGKRETTRGSKTQRVGQR